ncbi:MAG: hypothetical protein CUN56_06345 [Phototrophicales bacterium]|nr:MAG: hypothetical protein CUN56_06345 [Phototrophicales bacterium]RMG70592.1 MAG: hypothetical protein D6711_16915 [Chloroflexota bacterium]
MTERTGSTIVLKKREPCPNCYRTIDTNDGHPDSEAFVQCTKCGAIYHANCWAQIENSCVNRDARGYTCGHDTVHKVQLISNPPILKAVTRSPIRFEGVQTMSMLNRDTNTAQQATTLQATSGASAASATGTTTANPKPAPAASAKSVPRSTGFTGLNALDPWYIGITLVTSSVITIMITYSQILVNDFSRLPDLVAHHLSRNPTSFALITLCFAISIISIRYFNVRLTAPLLLRYGLPIGACTLALYFISRGEMILFDFSLFLENIFASIRLADITLVVISAAFTIIAYRQQNIFVRIFVGSVVIGGIIVISSLLFSPFEFRYLSVSELFVFAVALGAIPWSVDLFIPRVSVSAENSQSVTLSRSDVPENLRKRGILYRGIGLALPLTLSIFNIIQDASGCFRCRDVSDVESLAIAGIGAFFVAYMINRYIVEPILLGTAGGFWSRWLKAIFLGGFIGGMGVVSFMIYLGTIVKYDRNNDLLYFDPLLGIELVIATIIVAIIMSISSATGTTRISKVRGTIYNLFVLDVVLGIPFALLAGSDTYFIVPVAALAALSTVILTLPTWIGDKLAKGSYLP